MKSAAAATSCTRKIWRARVEPRTRAPRACRRRARAAARPVIAPTKSLRETREQQRAAERAQRVQAPQHRDGLRGRLGEVGAGIEDQLLGGDAAPRRERRSARAGTPRRRPTTSVVGAGIEQRALGRDARVHQHQRRARCARTRSASAGSRRPETSLTIARAGRDRRLGDRRLVRVDGDDRAHSPASRSISPHDARDLLLRGDGGRSPRADSPPTSTMSAPAASSARPRATRSVERPPLARVGERVGRRVEDAHQQRPRAAARAGARRRAGSHFLIRSLTSLRVTLPAVSTAATFSVNEPCR